MATAARSSALLAVLGASIVLSVWEIAGRDAWLDPFLGRNELSLSARHRLLCWMVGGACAPSLVALAVLAWRRSPTVLTHVKRLARLLAPATLLAPAIALCRVAPWQNDPVLLGFAIAIVVLVFERAVESSLRSLPADLLSDIVFGRERSTPSAWRVTRLVIIAASLGYGAFVTVLTIRYHNRLGTAAFDLGGYDNLFYNALHGRPLRATVAIPSGKNWSTLSTHAELSMYAFLPFYALRPGPEALLCIQAIMVGLGAVPIYLIAARRLRPVAAMVLALAYLLFPPVHSGNFYDFHFQPLGSTLVLWCFYFLAARKDVLFAVFFILALGCREDVSMSLAVAGILMLATGYRPVAGLIIAAISVIYFVAVRFVVMPMFGSWWFQDMYKDLLPAGDRSLFGVIKTVVSNPIFTLGTLLTREKLLHVLQIFLPLAFLPMRRSWIWFGFVPAVLGTILTTGYHPTTDTTFQYVFYWVPFVFVGAAVVLQQLERERGRPHQAAALAAMALATFLASLHWGVVLQRETFASAWGRIDVRPLRPAEWQTLHDLLELGKLVPKDASIALSEREVPHFSTRLNVFTLRVAVADADYILYRADSGGGGADQAQQALSSGAYERVSDRGQFVLLRRIGASAPRL
ncbi:MAG: DUF2079 domain-containing protein [Myxococcota bacterium]|nr:DUF2079 domain-containing protein [Myxococcota bacterium]